MIGAVCHPWRNPGRQGEQERQPLIIDPGPRTINQPNQKVPFSRDNIPKAYPGSFPDPNLTPYPVNTPEATRQQQKYRQVHELDV